MAGNICRCGTYVRIRAAIKRAAGASRRRRAMTLSRIRRSLRRRAARVAQGRRRRAAFAARVSASRAGRERAGAAADSTDGRFAPNAFIRIDRAGKTTLVMPQVEMGQGVYTVDRDDPRRGARRRFRPRSRSSMRRPATSSTAIRSSAFRSPAIPIPSAPSGSRCARPAPRRGRCWSQAAAQQWQVDPATLHRGQRRGRSTPRAGAPLGYGELVDAAQRACRRRRIRRSRIPRTSS